MKENKIHNIQETGFKVPKDYFNNLEDVILSHVKLKQQIDYSGFKTPEGYFETLENNIIEKISKKESVKVTPLFSKKNIIYASSIAAAILLFFNLSIFDKKSDWEKLDTETVENYIIDENIGSYEIAFLLSEENFIEDHIIISSLDQENLETYLLDNIDIEDLTIE